MNDGETINVVCGDCGENLPEEWARSIKKEKCPACGSTKKSVSLVFVEKVGIKVHD